MNNSFCEGLRENDPVKLLQAPKSDIHNHSTKGCRRAWLEKRLQIALPLPPHRFSGLEGMREWFSASIKPYCSGMDGTALRWEGAFAEAKRNHIKRLVMTFDTQVIDLTGGLDHFIAIIEGFHSQYCPDTRFEPALTYPSNCDAQLEADRMEQYISSGYFQSVDLCGGENVQPVEAFLPLYRKAEKYQLTKTMHIGETGSAEDIRRAVEVLGLDEIHHGIHAAESDAVMRFLADNRIQVNVCPTSNVMLGYAADYKNHPIKVLYENGVKVTINTDDLLLFDSSVENEYRLLYQAGTFSANQLDDIRKNGLTSQRR